MPRYYFSLANDRCFDDTDGLELHYLAAAREEHNYPGFFEIGGLELLRRLGAQAEEYSAPLLSI